MEPPEPSHDDPVTREFWGDEPRRSRGRRSDRTRDHAAVTRRTPPPAAGPHDPTPPDGAGLFDDLPDDPFVDTDDLGLGSYANLDDSPGPATGFYDWSAEHERPVAAPAAGGQGRQHPGEAAATGVAAIPGDHAAADRTAVALESRRRSGVAGIDPLLLRLGGVVAAAVLAVPVIGAFTGAEAGDDDDEAMELADTSEVADTTTTTAPPTTTKQRNAAALATDRGAAEEPAPPSDTEPRPECGEQYEIVMGDYWMRLSEASGSALDELLAVNDASTDTPLYPGDEICLPVGAGTPEPPLPPEPEPAPEEQTVWEEDETGADQTDQTDWTEPTSPSATQAPTTTRAPTTQAPTTQAPATTQPPTTTTQAPNPPSGGSPEQIIRDVWPDHLEDRALEIAHRESRYVPSADNGWCCYGLFQIYYEQHTSWLPNIGVNSKSDLFDPTKNAKAAYVLYQRAGGFGPWGG